MNTQTIAKLILTGLVALSLTFCANPFGSSSGGSGGTTGVTESVPGSDDGSTEDSAAGGDAQSADDGSLFDGGETSTDEPVDLVDYGFESLDENDLTSSAFSLVADGDENIIQLTPTSNSHTLTSPVFNRAYRRADGVTVSYKVRFTGDQYPTNSADQYRAAFILVNEGVPAYRVSVVSATSGTGDRTVANSNAMLRIEVYQAEGAEGPMWVRPTGAEADVDLGWANPLGTGSEDWIAVEITLNADTMSVAATLNGQTTTTGELNDSAWSEVDQWIFAVQTGLQSQFSGGGGIDLGAVRFTAGQ